jgi:RNA polymerase sigma factor (sigma-70 family)
MLHHDKSFVESTQAHLREPAERRRLLAGPEPPTAVRGLTARLRAVARAHRVPAHEVDDVVQTTWLRLLEHGDSIREPRAVSGWLQTTARRESLRVLRGAARTQPTDPAALPDDRDSEPGPDAQVVSAEVAAILGEAIDALPRRQRHLMRMLLREPDAPYTQVSAVLGMPIGSIGPTRARALERLRQDARLSSLIWQDG